MGLPLIPCTMPPVCASSAGSVTGEQFLRDWALAQFYFHVTTAYAILRNQGVQLGKPDWVPHMFAYIRPGTLPGG